MTIIVTAKKETVLWGLSQGFEVKSRLVTEQGGEWVPFDTDCAGSWAKLCDHQYDRYAWKLIER